MSVSPRTPRRIAIAALAASVALVLGACIGGRVLEGYPGYPFLAVDLPAAPDSAFFDVQRALEADGFELDFSEPEDGLINTRPIQLASGWTFLSVVVAGPAPGGAGGGSRAWIAGYVPVPDGARRIDPLDGERWEELRSVATRLSNRLGGAPPIEPGASEAPEYPAPAP